MQGKMGGTATSAISMGMSGAAIGSLFPGLGTFIGAGVGVLIGGVMGYLMTPDAQSNKLKPSSFQIQTSQLGLPVPVLFGTRKFTGNVIWYGNFLSHKVKAPSSGSGGGAPTIGFSYTVSFAIGVCIGQDNADPAVMKSTVLKIWEGKNLLDLDKLKADGKLSIYDGTQTTADSNLVTIMKAQKKTRFPVWKNLTYVFFHNWDLGSNANVPQFIFEASTVGGVTASMVFESSFSGSGFNSPWGITASDTNIFVADSGSDKVYKFDLDGQNESVILQSVGNVSDVKYHNNRLFIANSGQNKIRITDTNGNSIVNLDVSTLGGTIRDMTVGNSGLFVLVNADSGNDKIVGYDSNPVIITNNGYSVKPPRFSYRLPFSVASFITSDDSHIYISSDSGEGGTNNVYKYTIAIDTNGDGNITVEDLIDMCPNVATEPVKGLSRPLGVFVTDLYLYVVERTANRVSIFDKRDLSTSVYTNTYSQFGDPADLVVKNGKVYITDSNKDKVFVFTEYTYAGTAVYPSDVVYSVLTNTFYGMGILPTYTDETSSAITKTYCIKNDLKVSMLFDRQQSILDVLMYITAHHNGFVAYYNGQIYYNQLNENLTSVYDLTSADIVRNENESYINISTKSTRDYFNRIVIEYTKQGNEYTIGTAQIEDFVDIDKYGLKVNTIKLDGLVTYDSAYYIGSVILSNNLSFRRSSTFKVGPNKLTGVVPGNVITITQPDVELDGEYYRILNIRETPEYLIEVDVLEEIPSNYVKNIVGQDTSDISDNIDFLGNAPSVINPFALEIPPLFTSSGNYAITFSSPNKLQWAGTTLYKSYASNTGFESMETSPVAGITGTVVSVGTINEISYIDILLDDVSLTLSSALNYNTLISNPLLNLFLIVTSTNTYYCKFEDAALLSEGKWRLSTLIIDIVNFPFVDTEETISVGSIFAMYTNFPYTNNIVESEKTKTLYFKTPSYNQRGVEQLLSSVDYFQITLTDLINIPLSPYNIIVNNIGIDSTNVVNVKNDIDPVVISWSSRNRFNLNGSDSTNPNLLVDDYDFSTFELEIYHTSISEANLLSTIIQTTKSYNYTFGAYSTFLIRVRQKNTTGKHSNWSDNTTINKIA